MNTLLHSVNSVHSLVVQQS